MALLRPKHGPHMVLQIGSSWILIIVSRDVTRQISHCWVFPVAPLPKNGQNMALLWQNMVHTWSSPSWPKHGLHLVLKIGSTWILINMPRDVPCQISHCQVYPVVLFLKNGKNMALLLPKLGPNMFLQIASSWILIKGCSMPNFTLMGVFMAKTWSSYGPSNWFYLNLNQCAHGCSMQNFTLLGVSHSLLS